MNTQRTRILAPLVSYADTLTLERMVDDCGLPAVLDALGAICCEKEGHIRENWQDDALADVWSGKAAIMCGASFKVADGPRMARLANGDASAA